LKALQFLGVFGHPTEWAGAGLGWAGAGLGWGLQAVAKQSGRSFLHPAAAAVAMAVGPQPKKKKKKKKKKTKKMLLLLLGNVAEASMQNATTTSKQVCR